MNPPSQSAVELPRRGLHRAPLLNALGDSLRLGVVVGASYGLGEWVAHSTLEQSLQAGGNIAKLAGLGGITAAALLLTRGRRSVPIGVEFRYSQRSFLASLVSLWTAIRMGQNLRDNNPLAAFFGTEVGWVFAGVALAVAVLIGRRAFLVLLAKGRSQRLLGQTFFASFAVALAINASSFLGFLGSWSTGPRAVAGGVFLATVFLAAGALAVRACVRGRFGALRKSGRTLPPWAWITLSSLLVASLAVSGSPPPSFLTSSALIEHALVRIGSEVRAVLTTDHHVSSLSGAQHVELAWGTAPAEGAHTVEFEAQVRGPRGEMVTLLHERIVPSSTSIWYSRRVRLPQEITDGDLLLSKSGASEVGFWEVPILLPASPQAAPRGVILVSLDTLRADHLNAYGYSRRTTSPEFDRWTQEGALFETAISTAPGTLSSQMTLLTGRYPAEHGTSYANWRRSGDIPVLPARVPTLAQVVRAAGYKTAAFTGAGYFALPIGYSRGFTKYVSSDDATLGSAATVFEKAFAWLSERRHENFFLFLHTYEAHEPYLDERFVHSERIGPQDWRERNVALYDGDIRRLDEYLGRLHGRLDSLGLAENTLVVITSDHGEEFGDRFGVWNDGHGHSLFQEQIHVPLAFIGPGVPRGARFEKPVDLTIVAPTILRWLNVEVPQGMQDRIAIDFGGSGESVTGPAFSQDVWIGPEYEVVIEGRWKLFVRGETLPERFVDRESREAIRSALGGLAPRMLFNLADDPGERHSRAETAVDVLQRLEAFLERRHQRADGEAAVQGLDKGTIEIEGDTLERLRALGYLQ